MKVTVCFGSVRVVVPCGDGEILVRDLVREALLRYKKATGKGSDSWVSVHNLQSHGGGILDPDDRLSDVVDDREQILASFEDGDGAHHHGGGDGASGSSAGTGSPDIFHDGEHKYYPRTDIEVTGEQIASGGAPGAALQVRRGSEPALNQLLPVGPPAPPDHKRWSAAPLILEPPPMPPYNGVSEWNDSIGHINDEEEEEEESSGFRRIARDGSNRLSMQFLGDGGGYRWAEAAERASRVNSTSLPRESKRKEPLGQANNSTSPLPHPSENAEMIIIRNEPGPLGIHVVPDYDRLGKDRGLLVQGIEPGKRIDRDGQLAIYDRIIEINGENLLNMPFQRVHDIFKLYLTSPELRLKVIKNTALDSLRKPPPPIYPRFPDDKENVSMVECEQKQSTNTKVATVSPTKKVPAISKNLKSLLTANTRKIGRKIEIDLIKGKDGLGFSITTRDNPAGGNCPIYIKNIMPRGAAVQDGRIKIGDRLLEVNGVEMTGKSQDEAAAILRNNPLGGTVRIVVSRQEDVVDNGLPRIIDTEQEKEVEQVAPNGISSEPPNIPPLPQSHLQALQLNRQNNNTTSNNNSEKNNSSSSVAKMISHFQEAANITTINNSTEKNDDNMIFPWKHREILKLNIPVHDSEKAGLGISVKGKISGSQDLGIFIKNVINGGAASRDKRLRTNDQLLNVNGISLLHQSNSDATKTLQKSMLYTEGPVPGNITLTIARRASSPASSSANRSFNSRGSDPNLLNNSSSGELYSSTETDPSHSNSGSSTNTVIYNSPLEKVQMQTWNPVLDRLTGNKHHHHQQQQQQLRNESYYKATHDTWTNSMLANSSFGNLTTTTLNLPQQSSEPILIEDEYESRMLTHHQNQQRINVHMTNNKRNIPVAVENRNDHEPDGKANNISENNNNNKSTDSSASTVASAAAAPPPTDATYASQLSLENPQGFSRDAFGRQSMSEKRHATLDAKSTDTYQRTKKLREERKCKDDFYADKLGQLGPSLGMKKSSSLESLQTMVQEIQMQEEADPAYSYRGATGALKVIRGRGCDERVRAAVVDPNHQSEIGAKKHWLLDGPSEEREIIDGFNNVRGGPRQSSLNAAFDAKHKGSSSSKKKPGILKGIGSMFRFGKHRKMEFSGNVDVQHYHPVNEFDQQAAAIQQQEPETVENSQTEQQNQRVQQLLAQREQQIQREPIYQRHGFVHRHAEQVQVIPENTVIAAPPAVKYREQQQRVAGRKMQDQQRIRHTYYQGISDEGIYDQRQYGEYGGRPGSRSGITESSVPFTHYVNYNELQTHLSRKQHQYHSQRQVRNDNQLRPVSNFYEYESIQSMLNNRGAAATAGRGGNTVPAPSQNINNNQAVMYQQQDNKNANSLTRQQQQQPVQGRHPNGRQQQQQQSRGPFVTHVTIGEQNGTKV